jgi:type II secretory pathway pseudopilin PulG
MSDKYNLLCDKNAVSELVGYLILVTIAVTAIGIIYVMAMPQVSSSQDQAKFQSAEQAFTALDTHMSKSQYSNELSQLTEMKLNGGKLTVDESHSYINIQFLDGTRVYPDPATSQTGYLGTIYYTLNGREVGYEGGGIWEKYPDGGSAIISAPDFNYNGETLTLPLMQIKSSDVNSATNGESSSGTAFITSKSNPTPEPIYPNTQTGQSNPVKADQVFVTIHSRYYQAWANYINSNTDGEATVTHTPGSDYGDVTVTFYTHLNGEKKPFRPGDPIVVRGLNYNNPAPLSAFFLDLVDAQSSLQVNLRAPTSNSQIPGTTPALLITFQKATGQGTQGVTIDIWYTENNKVEHFTASKMVIINADNTAHIDWLDPVLLTTYVSNDNSWTWTTATYDKNTNSVGPSVKDVIEHYMVQMGKKYDGTFTLFKSNNNGNNNGNGGGNGNGGNNNNGWPGAGSTYTLDYDAHNVLTYMHITNNPISVTLG